MDRFIIRVRFATIAVSQTSKALSSLDSYDACLEARLQEYANDQLTMNAIFNHEPLQFGEASSLAFHRSADVNTDG